MDKKLDKGTEAQILDAAYRIIIRKGKAGTRMQEIADEAGVNKALLHYYYRSKDKIYSAVLHRIFNEILETVVGSIDFSGSYEQLIREFVFRHITALQKNRDIIPFFFSEIQYNAQEMAPLFREHLNRSGASLPMQFFQRTARAVETKEIRSVDPAHLLLNILSMDIFYFLAKPIFANHLGLPGALMENAEKNRAEEVADFIWESVRYREG